MESVVEKQRHLSGANGSNGSSLLVGSNGNGLNGSSGGQNNSNGNGSNPNNTNNSHSNYMTSHLPLTSLVPPPHSSVSSLVSQTLSSSTSSSALKIDGVNCPTIGEHHIHFFTFSFFWTKNQRRRWRFSWEKIRRKLLGANEKQIIW